MMFQKWILLAALGLAAPAMSEELHYNVAEFSESASVRVPKRHDVGYAARGGIGSFARGGEQ